MRKNIIYIFILLSLLSCSQKDFQIRTSFDNIRVDQETRYLVAAKPKDSIIFNKYQNKKSGRIYINYETFDTISAIAQVEDAPMISGKKAMHFKINSPNVEKKGEKAKSRVQLDMVKKTGMKSFVSEVSVFFPKTMNKLSSYPYPITWLTLQEYWNAPPNDKGTTFRISLGLWKSKTGKLHFGFKAQDYIDGEFIEVERGDEEHLEVPIGRWFRLRTEIKEGDKNTGSLKVSMVDGKQKRVLYKRKMQTMATAFCEKKHPQQGFTLTQPIKLYTSAHLTDWMRDRGYAIEAYFTDWKFDGIPYPSK